MQTMSKQINKKRKKWYISIITILMILTCCCYETFSAIRTTISSGDWNQPTTWDCGCMPAATDSAIISNGTIITITTSTTIKGVTVLSNASLFFGNGVTLNLNGGLYVESGGVLDGSNNTANLLKATTKNLRFLIDGDASVYRLAMSAGSNSDLYFYGSGNMTINSDLEVYGANPKIYNYHANLSVIGNIVKLGSGTFQWQQRDYSTLNIGGDMNDVDDLYTWAINTINYNGNGDQLILCPTAPSYFWNLSISGSGTKTLGSSSGGLYTDIHGNLSIESGCTLDVSPMSYDIHIRGNWINNGGSFNSRNATVTMEWGNVQSVNSSGGNETFYNLIINKFAEDVTLVNGVSIQNDLELISGDIILWANDLILETSASISGNPGNSSYIQTNGSGVVKYMINSASEYIFPVGDNNEYSPYTLTIHNATFSGDGFISMRVTDAVHSFVTSQDRISRYWSLNCGGLIDISYDFSCQYMDDDVEGTESKISSARINGTFEHYELVNLETNTLYSLSNIQILPFDNDFTGGDDGTLPVEFLHFSAAQANDGVELTWQTASENNNDFFTIEKSSDGITFISSGTISGAGFSNEITEYTVKDYYPFDGISYYRIKQTDFDGNFDYSQTIAVDYYNDGIIPVMLFPSPSSDDALHITFKYNTYDTVFLNVYNMAGNLVHNKILYTNTGENSTILNTSSFSKGKYIIQIIGFNRVLTTHFFKN